MEKVRRYHQFTGIDNNKSPVDVDLNEVTAYWTQPDTGHTVISMGVAAVAVRDKFKEVQKAVRGNVTKIKDHKK